MHRFHKLSLNIKKACSLKCHHLRKIGNVLTVDDFERGYSSFEVHKQHTANTLLNGGIIANHSH